MIFQSIASAAANAGDTRAPGGGGRAYYGGVVTTMMFLPVAMFVFFILAGLWTMQQGSDSGWSIVLIGLGGTAVLGFVLAQEFWKRSVEWNDKGVRFRWLSGEADLAWSEIEKVEIKTFQGGFSPIRFRDGRKFTVSPYLTGSRELLRELARRGVAFYKWGTTKPAVLKA
ncbi:MAG: hypothetical protein ABMA14_23910 [Hyphomonadaceae bacterium]